jgi:hypothetical protein
MLRISPTSRSSFANLKVSRTVRDYFAASPEREKVLAGKMADVLPFLV